MRNTKFVFVLATLFWVGSFLGAQSFFKGGVLTDRSGKIPSEVKYISYLDTNGTETFLVGINAANEAKIYRMTTGEFLPIVGESSLPGILVFRAKSFGFRNNISAQIETRPDGLHFDLYLKNGTLSNLNVKAGSYRIVKGQLEKVGNTGETINLTDNQGMKHDAKIANISVDFPRNNSSLSGEFVSVQSVDTTNRIHDGIFLRQNNAWTQVLQFSVNQQPPGFPLPYIFGSLLPTFGIQEGVDGSLYFGAASGDSGSYKQTHYSFNPRTKEKKVLYTTGDNINNSGVKSYRSVQNSDTGQKLWSVFTNSGTKLTSAPTPDFKPWFMELPTFYEGVGTAEFAGHLSTSNAMSISSVFKPSDNAPSAIVLTQNTGTQVLLQNKETLPNGKSVVDVNNGFLGQTATATITGCKALVATFKSDGAPDMLLSFDKPCITDAAADGGKAVLFGNNFDLGRNAQVKVNGVPVTDAVITPSLVTFSTSSIGGGEKTVQLVMDGGVVSNEVKIVVPLSAPSPKITSVTTSNFETRPIAPGGLLSVFGSNLCTENFDPRTPYRPPFTNAANYPLPTTLGGCRVLVNGQKSPMLFAANMSLTTSQVNAQVPIGTGSGTAKVQVQRCNDINCEFIEASSPEFTVTVLPASPTVLKNGDIPLVQNYNQNNKLVTEAPASEGDILVVYGTGFGKTAPELPDGMPATELANVVSQVQAWLKYTENGKEVYETAPVLGSSASPGYAALVQTNVLAPRINPDTGTDVILVVSVGGEYAPDVKLPYVKKVN